MSPFSSKLKAMLVTNNDCEKAILKSAKASSNTSHGFVKIFFPRNNDGSRKSVCELVIFYE